MEQHSLQNTIALLTRTPAALDALLRGLPEIWTHRSEGENTWTVFEVLAHLIDGERANWIPRAKMILDAGESQTFVPFDRLACIQESQGKPLPDLLDEFARLRTANLVELHSWIGSGNLQPTDLDRRGHHPALGSVTLSQLLATWAAHDLTHLHQITRTMAHQYRETVGSWNQYLGVLKCTGHSG
jgi:hypothetical protein